MTAAAFSIRLQEATTIETYKKRQQEIRRLESQKDKAAKRQEIKARKAGIKSDSDAYIETTENASATDLIADPSSID